MKRPSLLLISGLCLLISPAIAIIDTNENGLSDLWEKQHNHNELFPETFDPEADPDQDGWTNAEEAAAGTDPFDPNPPVGFLRPEILHTPAVVGEENGQPVIITPEAVTVSWPTLTGKQYTLQLSPDLSENWITIDEPFIGDGDIHEFNFTIEEADERNFYRVAVTDIDSDGDTLTNAEEHQLNTNPHLTDSDADGMADNIDPQPNSALPTFLDADGDGIADADDPQPNTSAGTPPIITSETANLSRIVNLIVGDQLVLIVNVDNPSGPPPGANDLKLLVSGTENNATFSAAGPNRFSATWTAEKHANYPTTIVQNLVVRFRDSRNATTSLEIVRTDVAEWQGMVAGIDSRDPGSPQRTFSIGGHADGVPILPTAWAGASGNGPRWYRGPHAIRYHGRASHDPVPGIELGTLQITPGMRYPFFILKDSSAPAAPSVTVHDISDPTAYPHGAWGLNRWSAQIRYKKLSGGNETFTFPSGADTFVALPQPVGSDIEFHHEAQYLKGEEWLGGFNNISPFSARTERRKMLGITAFPSSLNEENASMIEWGLEVPIEARIVGSAAGTLEHPGLPYDHPQHTRPERPRPLHMAPNQWHRIVVKVGPDAAVVARGVRLRLNPGAEGTANPQGGVELKRKTPTGNETYSPGEILEGTELYTALTGPSGLVLFARITPAVDRLHRLSLDLLPNGTNLDPLEVTKIELIPVDVDDNTFASGVDDVSITAAPSDTGYQNQFWIMAPSGNDIEGKRCSNSTKIKVLVEPGAELRTDCTHTRCDHVKLGNPNGGVPDIVLPPIPIGHGVDSHEVSWRGTAAVSDDKLPIYKIGNPPQQSDLPIAVKTMKHREVKIVIHYVTGAKRDPETGEFINLKPPVTQVTAQQIKDKLYEIYSRQINIWFSSLQTTSHTIDWDIGVTSDWGNEDNPITGNELESYNRVFDKGGNADDENPIPRPEENKLLSLIDPQLDANIDVFLIGGCWAIQSHIGVGNVFLPDDDIAVGTADRERRVVFLATEKNNGGAIAQQELLTSIAHEIGHVVIGDGHPDQGSGPAPLPGTPVVERLMFSDIDQKVTASALDRNLLVKAEWDEADAWLQAEEAAGRISP